MGVENLIQGRRRRGDRGWAPGTQEGSATLCLGDGGRRGGRKRVPTWNSFPRLELPRLHCPIGKHCLGR